MLKVRCSGRRGGGGGGGGVPPEDVLPGECASGAASMGGVLLGGGGASRGVCAAWECASRGGGSAQAVVWPGALGRHTPL